MRRQLLQQFCALGSRRLLSQPVARPSCCQAVRRNSGTTHPPPVRHVDSSPPRTSLFAPRNISGTDKVKPFFLTTPIFYVNASPHIGHLHSLLLADVLARYSRLREPSRPVIFATGTDEHGQKIQQAARAQGQDEEGFCTRSSRKFRDLADKANISYTDFIRTTEDRHLRAVEHFWNKLVEAGDIYKGTHSGWYCISDECFYTENQITKRDDGAVISLESGNEVVWVDEENWKFRLSSFQARLRDWVSQVGGGVYPDTMKAYVLSQIDTLEDLSISRPAARIKWGIPVPGDPDQTIYVWVDALINYITVLGYPLSTTGWPAEVHIVGKDIIRFHSIHWPALLFSAGMQPPSRVLAHAHWTLGYSKMSKSRGNVVDPIAAMDEYGVDGVRWYLMRVGGSLPNDSNYSNDQLQAEYNILAAQLGNLANRLTNAKILSKVGETWTSGDKVEELDQRLKRLRAGVDEAMGAFDITSAARKIMSVISSANVLFTHAEPWKARVTTAPVVYAYESLRLAGILLQPIMPTKAAELLDRLGVPPDQRGWSDAEWTGAEVDPKRIVDAIQTASSEWKARGVLFPHIASAETG